MDDEAIFDDINSRFKMNERDSIRALFLFLFYFPLKESDI